MLPIRGGELHKIPHSFSEAHRSNSSSMSPMRNILGHPVTFLFLELCLHNFWVRDFTLSILIGLFQATMVLLHGHLPTEAHYHSSVPCPHSILLDLQE